MSTKAVGVGKWLTTVTSCCTSTQHCFLPTAHRQIHRAVALAALVARAVAALVAIQALRMYPVAVEWSEKKPGNVVSDQETPITDEVVIEMKMVSPVSVNTLVKT